jgi:hypothetical protein
MIRAVISLAVIALAMPFAVLVCAIEMTEDAVEQGARAWVESL